MINVSRKTNFPVLICSKMNFFYLAFPQHLLEFTNNAYTVNQYLSVFKKASYRRVLYSQNPVEWLRVSET